MVCVLAPVCAPPTNNVLRAATCCWSASCCPATSSPCTSTASQALLGWWDARRGAAVSPVGNRSDDMAAIQMPFACKLLFQELQAMNVVASHLAQAALILKVLGVCTGRSIVELQDAGWQQPDAQASRCTCEPMHAAAARLPLIRDLCRCAQLF